MNETTDGFCHNLLEGLRDFQPAQGASAIVQALAALSLLQRQSVQIGEAALADLVDKAQDIWLAENASRDAARPFGEGFDIRQLSDRDQAFLLDRLRGFIAADADRNPDRVIELCLALARRTGPRSGLIALSPSMVDTLLAVLAPVAGETAYCAYSGAAETAMNLGARGLKVRLDLEGGLAAFWSAVAIASGVAVHVNRMASFYEVDEIAHWNALPSVGPFDLALVIPPIGLKQSGSSRMGVTSEMVGVELAAQRGRRSVAVVPASVLFRTTGADQAFKARLIERRRLKAVVALPSGSFLHSNIASGVLLFGEGAAADRVLMVDPSVAPTDTPLSNLFATMSAQIEETPWSRFAALDEISAQGFNLSPERYVRPPFVQRLQAILERGPTAPLGDLVEVLRPQMVLGARDQQDGPGLREVAVGDIGDFGLVEHPERRLEAEADQIGRISKARVRENDILLVAKGSIGKTGFIGTAAEDWIASQSFVILRPRRHGPVADAAYLYRYLTSEIGQTLIHTLKAGTTVPMLQMADIKAFPVLLPSAPEQEAVGRQVRELFAFQRRIMDLRQEGAQRQAQIWPADII